MKMSEKKLTIGFLLLFVLLFLVACGKTEGKLVVGGENTIVDNEAESEDGNTEDQIIYIIEGMDTQEETLTLFATKTGNIFRYPYNLLTKFQDSYGNSSAWTNFTVGTPVVISDRADSGALTAVKMSDSTWTYEDVTNYSIDRSQNLMTIGNDNYKLTDKTVAFAEDEVSALDSIGAGDTLRVVGVDNTILSVVITTGCGTIKLMNTEVFDGSMIQIGSRIFTRVSDGLVIEVPEGTYTVTAANDGWGGSAEYTVTRNVETVVNMEDLKGEGPQYCELSFTTAVEGANIYLDGSQMAVGEVRQVTYGKHTLQVVAEGYESWNKTLYVNSVKAEIVLELSEEDTTSTDSSTSSSSSSSASSSSSNTSSSSSNTSSSNNSSNTSSSSANNNTNSNSSTTNNSKSDVDYLTTLSSTLSSLLGSD